MDCLGRSPSKPVLVQVNSSALYQMMMFYLENIKLRNISVTCGGGVKAASCEMCLQVGNGDCGGDCKWCNQKCQHKLLTCSSKKRFNNLFHDQILKYIPSSRYIDSAFSVAPTFLATSR